MLNYKKYIAKIDLDEKAGLFHGEVINTKDVITFQGKTVAELKKAFKDSIEDYLEFCAQRNETPDKPFSGKFNLRLEPSLHQQAYIKATREKISINQLVTKAITNYLHKNISKHSA